MDHELELEQAKHHKLRFSEHMEQRNFRAPNIISWGLSFIKFQDGTLNFISLATITSAHQWITDWQEHSWIMEQYRSLPVTAFCENGQTEQIELLGEFH